MLVIIRRYNTLIHSVKLHPPELLGEPCMRQPGLGSEAVTEIIRMSSVLATD